ncbi:MAG: TonB-dependent receptor [Cyclobacteriaceae bacterium]
MRNIFKLRLVAIIIVLSKSFDCIYAQEEKKDDVYDLSLEELMNVPISSASKSEETLFDAPLSSYTITKSDIDRSGVTSIMEALRLAPGVIVRELTNGIYDIHIRGFDNATRDQHFYQKSNYATLIMIDSRPVYNPLTGGTYWETLPVDINVVERIEIVRGPVAPLFGPNAVSGAINIITSRPTSKNLNVNTNSQIGTHDTYLLNISLGTMVGKWNISASANYQNRGKYDNQYYSIAQNKFVTPDQLVLYTDPTNGNILLGSDYKKNLPNHKVALSNFAANAFIGYTFKKDVKLDVTLGTVQSESQKIYSGAIQDTYFSTVKTLGTYTNVLFSAQNLKVRTSVNYTTDNPSVGDQDLGIATLIQKYDYVLSDAVAEYDFKLSGKIKITPGLSYEGINFDDTRYHDNVTSIGLFNGKPSIHNFSSFLRSDFAPAKNFRVVAALRADKFSVPDKIYINYELASTYKFNESNLIRLAVTRANSGSFMASNYQNLTIGGVFIFGGNTHLNLFTIDMQEIGFRSKLSKTAQIDVDIFRQRAENFIVPPSDTQTYANSPLRPTQYGATVSANFLWNDRFQFKPFITLQFTTTENIPANWSKDHSHTPGYYGGYYLNFRPASKWNFNVNGYYFASHRQYDINDPTNSNPQGNIHGKFLVDLKASYTFAKGINLFVNVRNALNSRSREFYGADQTSAIYLVGISRNVN